MMEISQQEALIMSMTLSNTLQHKRPYKKGPLVKWNGNGLWLLVLILCVGCGGGDDKSEPADASLQATEIGYSDGALQAEVTATVVDAEGQIVAEAAVRLVSDRSSDVVEPAAGITDSAGQVVFTLRSSSAGYPKLQLYLHPDNVALGDPLDLDLGLSLSMETGSVSLSAAGWQVSFEATLVSNIDGVPLELTSDRDAGLDLVEPASQASVGGQAVTFLASSTYSGAPMFNLRLQGIENSNVASNMVLFRHGADLDAGDLELTNPGGRIPVTVTITDDLGPVVGLSLSLESDRGATDTIETVSGATDAAGLVVFQVSTTTEGNPTLSLSMAGLTLDMVPSLQLDFSGI